MPEKKTDFESKMPPANKCSCCPYGFHIDRDFVRYCDSLYNSAQLDKLRQQRRERRKEKKSVESYLGLGNVSSIDTIDRGFNTAEPDVFSKIHFEKPYEQSRSAVTIPHDIYHQNDGLQNAMKDFEDTWQMSLKKSGSSSEIGLKKNGFKPISPAEISAGVNGTFNLSHSFQRSRSSSTSSVSSQSTAISSASVPASSNVPHGSRIPAQMTTSLDLSNQLTSPALSMGVNRTTLSNIRDRMASSLQRMKELEEQVKMIPVLKVKLYALNEEKKSLISQLKCKESRPMIEQQLKKLENEGIMSPTLTRKCLSVNPNQILLHSPGMASSLNASVTKESRVVTQKATTVRECNTQTSFKESRSHLKNAATLCSVLTRDVGVGYVPNKFKSVGVGSEIAFKDLVKSYTSKSFNEFASISSESLESDSESLRGSDETPRSFIQTRLRKSLPPSIRSNIPIKRRNVFTNTDSKNYISKSVNTDESSLRQLANITPEKIMRSKSVSVSPLTCVKYSQTLDFRTNRNSSSQTTPETNFETPKITKASEKLLSKRDIGVGDGNISDNICASCKKIKKSVAVGDFNINTVICDSCSSKGKSSRPNSLIVRAENCENCVLRQTETVGVGDYDVNQVVCQNCEYVKSDSKPKVQTCSTGTNTKSDYSGNPSVAKSDINICDKCSATIHSVAQGFAANTTDSKIPRSNANVTAVAKTSPTRLSNLKVQVSKTCKSESLTAKVKTISQTETKIPSLKSSPITAENAPFSKDQSPERYKHGSDVYPNISKLPVIHHKKADLSKEVKAACKVLNDYLLKPERGGEKKTLSSLTIIQNEWFKVANQKKADPLLIEDYLDVFEEFSRLLLHRIVNLSDNNGNTALHYAISYGNFDVVSILIDSKVCDVNKPNKAGYSSIMLVALANMKNDAHHYVVQRLFSIGDINLKASQNGQTALMLAVSHGKKDIVKILLDVGAEVNLQDKDGSTALMCAAEHGHLDIVKLLLSHPEIDPTIVDNDDCNALTIAMEAGHKDIGLLIYTNMNFSRGSSPYSTLKSRKRSTPRSTPPPRTPTLRTPPLPSPHARSTNCIPSSFQFPA